MSKRVVPFTVWRNHCDDRSISYSNDAYRVFIRCKCGPDKCNETVCPVWNSADVELLNEFTFRDQDQFPEAITNKIETHTLALRDINLQLKSPIPTTSVGRSLYQRLHHE